LPPVHRLVSLEQQPYDSQKSEEFFNMKNARNRSRPDKSPLISSRPLIARNIGVAKNGKEAIMTVRQHEQPELGVQIRWLIRRDMADVLRIEHESFEFPWTEEDFLSCLRQRNCIGMVAEHEQKIVGFMIYELHKSKLNILNFAVGDEARRSQVGTQMVQKLVDKLSQQRRNEIILEVRETNLSAQLFFSNHGFRAVSILRGHYDDTTEDAYIMRYRLEENSDMLLPMTLRNRISEFDAA
jgi:[ribosomal protein S18]-alanine N-acetyltransferase